MCQQLLAGLGSAAVVLWQTAHPLYLVRACNDVYSSQQVNKILLLGFALLLLLFCKILKYWCKMSKYWYKIGEVLMPTGVDLNTMFVYGEDMVDVVSTELFNHKDKDKKKTYPDLDTKMGLDTTLDCAFGEVLSLIHI